MTFQSTRSVLMSTGLAWSLAQKVVFSDNNTSLSIHSAPGSLSYLVLRRYYPRFTGLERSSHSSKVTQSMNGTSKT